MMAVTSATSFRSRGGKASWEWSKSLTVESQSVIDHHVLVCGIKLVDNTLLCVQGCLNQQLSVIPDAARLFNKRVHHKILPFP